MVERLAEGLTVGGERPVHGSHQELPLSFPSHYSGERTLIWLDGEFQSLVASVT